MKNENYKIGWICALPCELAAAIAVLDQKHAPLPARPEDDNIYTLGDINGHNIVITCLPQGLPGKVSAARVANQLLASFPSVRFGLLVGIGGGVPSTKRDIRLGDVVVSQPGPNSSGILHYGFGRMTEKGEFPCERILNKPPEILLKAVAQLEAELMQANKPIPKHLYEVFRLRFESKTSFSRPQTVDRLFATDYEHADSQSDCALCEQDHLVKRNSRVNDYPIVHYGVIASTDNVMRQALVRDQIARQHAVLCFEMEASGLMDHLPCLVVRGICDYADSHKTKTWQSYAAATAAVYASEVVKHIPRQSNALALVASDRALKRQGDVHFDANHERSSSSAAFTEPHDALDASSRIFSVAKSGLQGNKEALLPRLSTYQREKAHRRLKRPRVDGTADWLLESSKFTEWVSCIHASALWCNGALGCGKTVMCTHCVLSLTVNNCKKPVADTGPSGVIDELSAEDQIDAKPLFYVYCELEESTTLKAASLFEALTKQMLEFLVQGNQSWPTEAQTRLERSYVHGQFPDFDDIYQTFNLLFRHIPNATIIIDGIDEMEADSIPVVVDALRSLWREASKQKLIMFSREELGLNVKVEFAREIKILPKDTERSMSRFIDSEISSRMTTRRALTTSRGLMDKVRSSLFDHANGMFLWVHLQLEALWFQCYSDEDIRDALENLPPDLPTTYARCLQRIPAAFMNISKKMMRWVSVARRPLHMEEIREAVALTPSSTDWSSLRVPHYDVIMACCANLLLLDKVDGCFRFLHSSVDQYLHDDRCLSHHGFQLNLRKDSLKCGEECVTYLSLSEFQNMEPAIANNEPSLKIPNPTAAVIGKLSAGKPLFHHMLSMFDKFRPPSSSVKMKGNIRPPQFRVNPDRYCFLNYARQYWPDHTRHIDSKSKKWMLFNELATEKKSAWKLQPWNPSGFSTSHHLPYLHGLLIFAIKERHEPLFGVVLRNERSKLINVSKLPNAEDGLLPLQLASRTGFCTAVKAISSMIDVSSYGPDGLTALHHAALKNHCDVANILLSTKPKIALDLPSKTQYGLPRKLIAIPEMNGSDVSSLITGKTRFWRPLEGAVVGGHMEMTRMLLDPTTNAYDLLSLAAAAGQFDVCEVLNPPFYPIAVANALMIAYECQHHDFCRKMYGSCFGAYGWKAVYGSLGKEKLRRSEYLEQHEILEWLVTKASSTNSFSVNYFLEIVRAFTDFSLYASQGDSQRIFLDFMDILLPEDVGLANRPLSSLRDEDVHRHLVIYAARQKDAAALGLLLREWPTLVNAQDDELNSLLMLVIADMRPSSKPLNEYRTVIKVWEADDEDEFQALDLLIRTHAINVNAKNHQGMSALHVAVEGGKIAAAQALLRRRSIDIDATNAAGDTALNIAERKQFFALLSIFHLIGRKYGTLFEMFAQGQIDANVRFSYGMTLLMYAVERNDDEGVGMILTLANIDINASNVFHESALIIATKTKDINPSIMKRLLSIGNIALNAVDNYGNTALMCTVKRGAHKLEATKLLLQKPGLDVNRCDKKGYSPLMMAVMAQCQGAVSALLESEAIDLNYEKPTYDTAFLFALKIGDPTIQRLLIQHKDIKKDRFHRLLTPNQISNIKAGATEFHGYEASNALDALLSSLNLRALHTSSRLSVVWRDVSDISSDMKTLSGDMNDLSGDMNDLSGDMNDLSGDMSDFSGSTSDFSGWFE